MSINTIHPSVSGIIDVMGNRHGPSCDIKVAVLISQRGCCLYCFEPLDGFVYHRGIKVYLELQWDHTVPYSYIRANPDNNWAASCHICNGIKGDKIFQSIVRCREWIIKRRDILGYSNQPPLLTIDSEPEVKITICGVQFGYWRVWCMLDSGHDGEHLHNNGRTVRRWT